MNGAHLTLGALAALTAAGAARRRSRGTPNTDRGPRWLMRAGGDISPLDYGGGWITIHPDGSLTLWWVDGVDGYSEDMIEDVLARAGVVGVDPDDADLGLTVWPHKVYRVDIDDDVLNYHDWVEPQELVRDLGNPDLDLERIRELSRSPNPAERARLLEEIGRYWGFENLDAYPVNLTGNELRERWPQLDGDMTPAKPGRRSLRGTRGALHLLPKKPRSMTEENWAAWNQRRKALSQKRNSDWEQALPMIGVRR